MAKRLTGLLSAWSLSSVRAWHHALVQSGGLMDMVTPRRVMRCRAWGAAGPAWWSLVASVGTVGLMPGTSMQDNQESPREERSERSSLGIPPATRHPLSPLSGGGRRT
jgi:hypothetical protein